ncbi:hypothetical protein TWF694_006010 [Orbilia ellipsospora]|uniref:Uncharacterized protein n=1 Tax=Orbilia ellipsospora TaxID=2528407 RepID=A0AAV9WRV2_9PEZI
MAALTNIKPTLDTISKELNDLNPAIMGIAHYDTLKPINALYEAVIENLIQSASAMGDPIAFQASVTALRQRIVLQGVEAAANATFNAMCSNNGATAGYLADQWKYFFGSVTVSSAIPDPVNLYTAMKKFSLQYQMAISRAASLLKYLVYTEPNIPANVTQAQYAASCPEMQAANSLEAMVQTWDQILETGSTPIIPSIIYSMAQAFLVDSGEGSLNVFWDRSNGWGVRIRRGIIFYGAGTDMIGLDAPRCTNSGDLDGAPFLFRDSGSGNYFIRFKTTEPSGDEYHYNGVTNGFIDIGIWVCSDKIYDSWYGDHMVVPTDSNCPNTGVNANGEFGAFINPQALSLSVIPSPGDSDNIYFHINFAAPLPTLKGWNSDGSAVPSAYFFQATAEGQNLLYFNDDCAGQYDTQFAFRTA